MFKRIRACRATAVAACLLVSTAVPSRAAEPVYVAPCNQIAVSPDFVSDRTAFCAGRVRDKSTGNTTGYKVFRSTDGGKTWVAAVAAGLASTNPAARVTYFGVSPLYRSDHTVFLQLGGGGLFSSVDGGDTFLPVAPTAWGQLTAFVSTVPGGLLGDTGARTEFVMALHTNGDGEPNESMMIDPVTRSQTPVVGTPANDAAFAVSDTYGKDGAAFAVANHGIGLEARVEVYRCDATFTCGQLLHTFPKRWTFDRIWLSANFAATKTIYASIGSLGGPVTLWWSRDAGKTWSRWTAAEKVLGKDPSKYTFGFGQVFSGARSLYLRVYGGASGPTPVVQLFRSTNNGATWTRVAYARSRYQPGPRGTMPADLGPPGDGIPAGFVTATADGRIFVLGSMAWVVQDGVRPETFFCSSDSGKTWAPRCR